ncbi:MAG: hypothetical protein AAFY11_03950 [Cyanobacteria bacterium J06641_5]
MKLRTSVFLAGFLAAICVSGGILCGWRAYGISNGAVSGVSLPDNRPGAAKTPAPARTKLLTEAEALHRANSITNFSSYGAPPKPAGGS